jgi:hypothetical protein
MKGNRDLASLLIHNGASLHILNKNLKLWSEVIPKKDQKDFKNIEKIGNFVQIERTSSVKPRSSSTSSGSTKGLEKKTKSGSPHPKIQLTSSSPPSSSPSSPLSPSSLSKASSVS